MTIICFVQNKHLKQYILELKAIWKLRVAFGFSLLTACWGRWVRQAIQSWDTHWFIILHSVTHHLKGLQAHEIHWWNLTLGHTSCLFPVCTSPKKISDSSSHLSMLPSPWPKSSMNIKEKTISNLWIIYVLLFIPLSNFFVRAKNN